MSNKGITRRTFVKTASAVSLAASGPTYSLGERILPLAISRVSPNEKLNVAAIGAGGKGEEDIQGCSGETIVALCDPDWDRAADTFKRFPKAKRFKDYRVMLDKMPEIDALTISTPDHTHAPAAYRAMKMSKHVYVQKPLTHTVAEAHLLTETAREMKVATQMGNQGHSGDGVRELYEMIGSGAIGQVREVHAWTDRPDWPQGMPDPLPEEPVPDTMDWEIWIGSAPFRPYNHGYAPSDWRAWQNFGAGALGDMACHIMDPAYWTLNLGAAHQYSVEVLRQDGRNSQTFPKSSVLKYSFPARGVLEAVDLYWYDGGNQPDRPKGVPEDQMLGNGDNGSLFIGDKGIVTVGTYGRSPRLLPDEKMADYKRPDPWVERIDGGPYVDWIRACKGGQRACSNFEYSGPFTMMVQLGNLALLTGAKIEWNNLKGVVTNRSDPEVIISKEYRMGWELPL